MLLKGSKVRILRKESFWYKELGTIVSIEKLSSIRYPYTIKFNSINYNELNVANFCLAELEIIN